jgi:hypothetical protein
MIKPTVGRVVHYFQSPKHDPQAAIITCVHNDRIVNLAVFASDGGHAGHTSVTLAQDADQPSGPHARWMEYQRGQAQKTEQLEKKLAAIEGKGSDTPPDEEE